MHITSDKFGSGVDIFKLLMSFVEKCHADGILFKNGYHRQVVLRDLYLQIFGLIAPGKSLGNSLDLIAMTNREGHWQSGPLSRRLRDYREFKIWDQFKLSWNEWVDQPRYMVEQQLEMAIKEIEREASKMSKAVAEVDRMIKEGKLESKMRDQAISMMTKNNSMFQ